MNPPVSQDSTQWNNNLTECQEGNMTDYNSGHMHAPGKMCTNQAHAIANSWSLASNL